MKKSKKYEKNGKNAHSGPILAEISLFFAGNDLKFGFLRPKHIRIHFHQVLQVLVLENLVRICLVIDMLITHMRASLGTPRGTGAGVYKHLGGQISFQGCSLGP